MINFTHGNLLKAPAEALVNTVNTHGVMGKGIALQFKNAYPDMYQAYEEACRAGTVTLGRMHVYDLGGLADGPRWIINFPTKGHWRSRSQLNHIKEGLADLVVTVERLGIRSLAVPPLGCGNGGLSWAEVRPMIEAAFADVHGVDVMVYPPDGAPPAADMAPASQKPKMTPGRATLVLLMHRYLQGLLDPFVSLLEVHKLMYFMQEAGQDLKLKYTKDKFGPYAANLAQVLKRVEGHYVVGFGDGGSDPRKTLELLPEGVDSAFDALARDDETNRRLDRVAKLIQGFEDPYGMELLSTMLWVMVENPEARLNVDVAIADVQNWSARKRDALKPEHLAKAWEQLKAQEWDFLAHSIAHSRSALQ